MLRPHHTMGLEAFLPPVRFDRRTTAVAAVPLQVAPTVAHKVHEAQTGAAALTVLSINSRLVGVRVVLARSARIRVTLGGRHAGGTRKPGAIRYSLLKNLVAGL
jgi:hypothetical protein